jgi:hypothetical protein
MPLMNISAEKRKPSTPPTTGIDELGRGSPQQIMMSKDLLLADEERVVKEKLYHCGEL